MENGKVVIKVENLAKTYEDTVAVDNISFEVGEGEIFGLLGPNGAGKTTTLEIIETLRQPSSGKIEVDGLDIVHHSWEIKSRIGVQLQEAGFYPDLTLVELLKMFGGLYQVRVNPIAVLRRFSLEEKKKSFWQKLSGGQKQRFSIATTLIHDPKIIFLDEPTTGLDPQARVNLWDEIRKMHKEGRTIVLTTHYMQEAEELCDRVAVMDQGKIIKIGTPHDLIEELLASGFKRDQEVKKATLEDVFLHLTGRHLREESPS
ncbi:MAG: ABC transporter ATP-binding protein [Candidatus Woykebacteria bacterium GWB1_45_5]|uniref:ABC transporter ATP-binding protein n=2 Tax=Candidatus Woykeibacteriota TaxID=1817899 RepID=A0A1G1W1S6_9BACT|nr:MAG: ABC transporter ATP-binding protein [Candidatus Woykebacteria bacterium GWA1_44_8]OGY23578.1 MAG: ABC transporter ATP-binding protein [Candidatus Woykebacteria bacterium GWB1_45_5]